MAESEAYCECCGKPMQILFTREYVKKMVKEERERCAKVCDAEKEYFKDAKTYVQQGRYMAATYLAGAIRKMGET